MFTEREECVRRLVEMSLACKSIREKRACMETVLRLVNLGRLSLKVKYWKIEE